MSDNNLAHLIYTSISTQNFSDADLVRILQVSRNNNSKIYVTGILLYNNGNFFQVLEGEKETIEKLYEIIKQDPRHQKVTSIVLESIPKRYFNNWSMGFVKITEEQLKSIAGLNDFFTGNTCLADIDPGRAKKLLQAFASGYWQQQLQR